jgi:3-hydroxyisobutyrate dehydrogenase-like beta-hydroxyacid dehydrogenase
MESSDMRIGFVGLGRMGSGMARSLVRAGQDLIVWNRSPGPAEELAREGARRARDLSEVFQSDAVITMLATDAAIRETILGQGIIERARPGILHIVSATISVPFAQELERTHRERGLAYVSAPVLGRPDVAAAGELNVLVAGERTAVERATPIIAMFAKKVWPFGEKAAMANVAKLATNFALACAIETMSEACALGRRNGLDPSALIELFTSTLFAAPAYKVYGPVVAKQTFEPAGFLLTHGLKDIRQAIEAGELSNVPLPFASVLRDNFVDALAHGDAEKDWSAIAAVALRRAGF